MDVGSFFFDGMTLAVGEPAPMSLVRMLLKQDIKNLTLIGSE